MQFRRQISEERQSSHLRAMALHILQSPGRVGGMSVIHAERRLNERMRATDTGIQKRNVARIWIISVGRTAREFVDPLRLFVHWQAVEEIRCDGRSGKGAHAAQSADGLSELIAIGLYYHNGIFGKLQPIRSHCDAIVWCGCDEGFGHSRLEPNLPDGRNIRSGKFAWRAAPEGTQPRFRDSSNALHQVRVLRTPRDDFTIFLAIRRVFSPKLLDLLAQLFDTLGCRKNRRALFGAAGNWSIFDAQQHQAAGVQAVLF